MRRPSLHHSAGAGGAPLFTRDRCGTLCEEHMLTRSHHCLLKTSVKFSTPEQPNARHAEGGGCPVDVLSVGWKC